MPLRKVEVLWALLGQPPSSGFDICTTLSEAAGRRCTPGRLLPVLIRLEDAGLVTVDRTSDPYAYSLTPAGTTAAYEAGPGRAQPAVLVMVDLVGFTRFTEEHGDSAAHEQASRLHRVARSAATGAAGKLVKSLGDGVLLALPADTDPLPVVRQLATALTVSGHPWLVHGGAHAGAPIRHGGDLFGRDVNLVSRLCARAGAGELLVSAPDGDEALEVEGFDEPVRVQRVPL